MGWGTVTWYRSLFKTVMLGQFCAFHGIGLGRVWGTPLPLKLFKNIGYWPEIWWDDAQYHGVDHYLKWPFLCAFRGTLKFFMTGLNQVWVMMTPIRKLEETTLWPEIWWHDAKYHEADYYCKWSCSVNAFSHFLISAGRGVLSFSECLVYIHVSLWYIHSIVE